MSQEIEIEYKTLLTRQEYDRLQQALNFPHTAVKQVNYYFETAQFTLKEQHSALRIREKNGHYVLTLKEPHEKGILETHDHLTKVEFEHWMNGQPVPKEHVTKQLMLLDVPLAELLYFGALATERRTFTDNGISYVLDKSSYNGVIDYELEIEAPSAEAGEKAFQQIIEQYPVTKQQSITKIERFFTSLPAR